MVIAALLLAAAPSARPRSQDPAPSRIDAGGRAALFDRLDAWDDDRRGPPALFVQLLGEIRNDPSIPQDLKVDHLLRYADTHPKKRTDVLALLTDWRIPRLGPWLLERREELTADNWGGIFRVLNLQYAQLETWRDPLLLRAFFAEIANGNDEIRAAAVGAVALAGDARQVVALLPRLAVDRHSGIRYFIYAAQTRFDTRQGNTALRSLLRANKEPSIVESIVGDDLVRNHRHDFLGDLQRLRARLAAVTGVAQRDAATEMIRVIDSATAQLERDKKSGLPAGEKLDVP